MKKGEWKKKGKGEQKDDKKYEAEEEGRGGGERE